MIKKLAIISIVFLVYGCGNGGNEQQSRIPDGTYRPSGFHAFISHGTGNTPVSLVQVDTLYHLFYSTGIDEWGHLASNDLLSWKPEVSFPIATDGLGAVVWDDNNRTGLDAPWNIIISDGDAIYLTYSKDGKVWEDYTNEPVLRHSGIPSINWSPDLEVWFLTLADESSINVYSSTNLISWTEELNLSQDSEVSRASLLNRDGKWFMMYQGEGLSYQQVFYNGTSFEIRDQPLPFEGIRTGLGAILNGLDETIFIARTTSSRSDLPTFTTPLAVNLNEDRLVLHPTSNFQNSIFGKRRTKLKRLLADGPAWFSFTIEESFEEVEIIVSDDTSDVRVRINGERKEITFDGSALMSDKGSHRFQHNMSEEGLKVDILIDHASIDLFLEDGTYATSILALPDTFFSKVEVFVNGKKSDPRGVLYDIGI